MRVLQSGSVAQDDPCGAVVGRRVSRLACVAILAAALLGSMLLLWANPNQALACESESPHGACVGELLLPPAGLGEGEGGPVLYHEGSGVVQKPKVYVIFWGSNIETTTEGKEDREMLLKLFEGMKSGSAWEGIITQYFDSTAGAEGRVGSSVTTASWIDKSVTAPTNVNEPKLEEEIEHAISTNKWTIEQNAVFVLTTAPGSTYEETFRPGACAYHKHTSANAIYAFIPYQGDKRYVENECVDIGNPSKSPIRKTSKSASHEFSEAATDPYGNKWYAESGDELADICQSLDDKELPSGAWAQEVYDDYKNECAFEDLNPPHAYAVGGSASSITSTNATLTGTVNPEAYESHYYFELGTTKSYGTRTSEVSAGSGAKNVSASQTICGLASKTAYDFRVAETNSTGTTDGENKTFTTAESGGSGCPSAITEEASNVKKTEATLNGTVNPDGLETKYHFEYGTTASYGKSTSEASAGSGTSGVKESQTTTGLSGGTEYHFRIVASNSTGTTYGADKTFKTITINPPTVTTGAATGITEKEATLNGTVNPEGSETKYYFEYGTTESLGSKTAEVSAGSGTTSVEVSKVVTGLTASTTYYYRIAATNAGGTTFGAKKTFATSAKPTAETKPATSVGETTATLKGTVNPKGAETKYYFEYGTTESYGSKTAEVSAGSGTANVEVSKEITGLLRNTTYDFRVVATNVNGTTDGANQKFTTLSSVITGSANGITATEAVVHGTVNPHGLATTDQFEYGLTTSYGTTVPAPAESAGSGTTVVAKGYILTGLLPGTTYHFRLVEINSEGTIDGKDATFTTSALTTEFVSAFGSAGTGNGQFDEPTGIGVNPINGELVVSDEKNNRVQVFNEKGEFVRTFGTEGAGNGQFKEPRGVAVDSKGNIWVTDTGNDRVQEFNEKGEYLAQLGTKGTGNGQFTEPKGLAVDSKGNIWVADSGNARVQEFNEKREYVRQFAAGTNPIGVAVDSKGNVWTDNEDETGAIEEHNEKGELVQKFATRGEGNGQVLDPKRLTVVDGSVWVPDAGNNRVDVFNEKGEYVTKFGSAGSEPEEMKDPTGIAVDTHGNVWVADDENNRVDHWRISVLRPTFSSAFGSAGTGNGQFDEPTGIGVNPINGTVVVSDEKNNRVQEFNEKGEFVRTFGTEGAGNGQFKEPRGVAIDAKGNIWVTDTGNDRVEEFNEKGEYLAQLGTKGTGNGQFTEPKGLAVDSKGNIWVADSGNARVQEFNEKREYVRQFAAGTNPIGVAVDSKGNVWTDNEDETGAIEEHNETGVLVQKFATRGEGKGQVLEPKRLAVDSAGDVWVPDAGNNRVDVFNERGELLRTFGTYGTGSEEMEYPTGVAVDHGGHVWIADDENNRVDEWIR